MENAPMRRAIPILQHLFLLYFLFMTLYALIFTMTRVQYFPFIPWTVLRFHYGMMAPYQGDTDENADLLVGISLFLAAIWWFYAMIAAYITFFEPEEVYERMRAWIPKIPAAASSSPA